PELFIGHEGGRRYHEFKCVAKGCRKGVRRYLDTKDAKSTSNMRKHAKRCWGDDAVRLADEASGCDVARKSVVQPLLRDGTITASFERKKGKVTYMHRQHTKTETRAEMVCWVSESLRPFSIVRDRSFNNLMKTGRPEYYIPSPQTVSRDVRLVFKRTRERIAKMLQVSSG
ncbi:hypothetical protein M378DRAFT_83700, partial [Amanita muscaria Koide BX008]